MTLALCFFQTPCGRQADYFDAQARAHKLTAEACRWYVVMAEIEGDDYRANKEREHYASYMGMAESWSHMADEKRTLAVPYIPTGKA